MVQGVFILITERTWGCDLVGSTATLHEDVVQLLQLLLGTTHGSQLYNTRPDQPPNYNQKILTRFLASLRARLSLLFFSNSMMRRS